MCRLFLRDGIEVACVVKQSQQFVHSLTISEDGVLERVDEKDVCEVRLNFGISEIAHVRKPETAQGEEPEINRGRTCVRRLAGWFSEGPQKRTKWSRDSLEAVVRRHEESPTADAPQYLGSEGCFCPNSLQVSDWPLEAISRQG